MIAGHIDGNESVITAMKREAYEEAGIQINEEDLKIVHVMHRNSTQRESIDYFFIAQKYSGEIQIMEKDKCDELSFYDINNLPNNTIAYVKDTIEYYKNDIPFSTYGWEE